MPLLRIVKAKLRIIQVRKNEFELLEMLEKKSGMKCPASLSELKDRTPIFDTVVEKEQMENTVSDFLKVE